MEVAGKVVVVTGAASGIGCALATRFAELGAKVVVSDVNSDGVALVASRLGALGVTADVGDPDSINALVAGAVAEYGPVDIFCSNAGYSDSPTAGLSGSVDDYQRIVDVNLLAHVWAAKAVVPSMVERGGGYLLQTISSASLITGPSAPGYTLTKHGALGFAEWMTLNYGHLGIRVSCLCPNAVYTGMFGLEPGDISSEPPQASALGEVLKASDVAAFTIAAMQTTEPFLVLPHARVADSFLRKATDYDEWIAGTRRRLLRMREQL
ncbi:MAG: SDR family NAD(P)-dependent oxidoreductase [Actinomycetota bacterium]|nr:SDR family NAD(P)-dependent oxidoreductase [Actinomycetota bacterium]